jgi:hypothetical protein
MLCLSKLLGLALLAEDGQIPVIILVMTPVWILQWRERAQRHQRRLFDKDVPCSQQTNEATIQSPDNDEEEYGDCTYDLRDYVDPASILRRPP